MAKKRKQKSGKGKGKDAEELAKDKAGKKGKGKADKKGTGKDAKDKAGKKGVSTAERPTATTGQPAESRATGTSSDGARPPVDQVTLLKLALRDTEAKLVAAEHRLHQVQQQLDDERRALAEATAPTIEAQEAVVDAAVAETVAEAVVAAEVAAVATTSGAPRSADAAAVAAATLEDAADAIDAALTMDAGAGQAGAGTPHGPRSELTPPLPEQGSDTEPNESWTLVHLRKEAERRGITGVSNLPKAALVERLRA